MANSELVTKISFIGSLAPLDKLNAGLNTSIKTIGVATLAYTAIGTALNSWVNHSLEATMKTIEFSESIGINVESLQKWNYVALQTGSSAQAVESSFSNVNKKLEEYVNFNKGEGKYVLESLGISALGKDGKLKDAGKVIEEVSNKMRGLNDIQQKDILSRLGIDDTMFTSMKLTSEQLGHLKDRAEAWGLVTEEQAEQVVKYKRSLSDLGVGFDSLKTQLAISLAPVLEEVVEKFSKWFKENKKLIGEGLSKTFEILSSFGKAIGNTLDFIDDMVKGTTGWTVAIGILTTAFIYSRRAFLMSPFGIAAAIITALILVIDDLKVAFRGGNSVLKDFFASFNIDVVKLCTSAFEILKGTFYGIGAVVLQISESIAYLFALLEKGGKLVGIDFDLGLEDKFKQIKALKEEWQGMAKASVDKALDTNILIDKEKGITLGSQTPKINQNSLLPNTTNNSSSVNNTQNNNVKIEVKTSDPLTAGNSVKNALERQTASANQSFQGGGY